MTTTKDLAAQARKLLEFVEQDAMDLIDNEELATFFREVSALEAHERGVHGEAQTCEWCGHENEPATTPPTAPAQDAQGFCPFGGGYPLWEYAARTVHEVKQKVMMKAAAEGYMGTTDDRLAYLGWEIRPVAATPSPQAPNAPLYDPADVAFRASQAVRVPPSAERSPIISAYTITEGINGIKVQRAQQIKGPAKWAVRKPGLVLGRSGEWDWEPMPSSRTKGWIVEFRFDSADEAIAAAQAIVNQESSNG